MTRIYELLLGEKEIVKEADAIAERLYDMHMQLQGIEAGLRAEGADGEAERVKRVALVFHKLGLEVETWDLTVDLMNFEAM